MGNCNSSAFPPCKPLILDVLKSYGHLWELCIYSLQIFQEQHVIYRWKECFHEGCPSKEILQKWKDGCRSENWLQNGEINKELKGSFNNISVVHLESLFSYFKVFFFPEEKLFQENWKTGPSHTFELCQSELCATSLNHHDALNLMDIYSNYVLVHSQCHKNNIVILVVGLWGR